MIFVCDQTIAELQEKPVNFMYLHLSFDTAQIVRSYWKVFTSHMQESKHPLLVSIVFLSVRVHKMSIMTVMVDGDTRQRDRKMEEACREGGTGVWHW